MLNKLVNKGNRGYGVCWKVRQRGNWLSHQSLSSCLRLQWVPWVPLLQLSFCWLTLPPSGSPCHPISVTCTIYHLPLLVWIKEKWGPAASLSLHLWSYTKWCSNAHTTPLMNASVLVFCGCCNKWLQTWYLKILQIYSLWVLVDGSLKSVSRGWNPGCAPLGASKREAFLAFSGFWL